MRAGRYANSYFHPKRLPGLSVLSTVLISEIFSFDLAFRSIRWVAHKMLQGLWSFSVQSNSGAGGEWDSCDFLNEFSTLSLASCVICCTSGSLAILAYGFRDSASGGKPTGELKFSPPQ